MGSLHKLVAVVLTLLAVVLAGFFTGMIPEDMVQRSVDDFDIPGLEALAYGSEDSASDNRTLYNIETDEEWISESGERWPRNAVRIGDDRIRIGDYTLFSSKGYKAAVSYRTKTVDLSRREVGLDRIQVQGYLTEEPESAFRVMIHDCAEAPEGESERIVEYCYGDNVVYNSSLVTDPGRMEFQKNLSGITVDGYMHVYLELLENTTSYNEEEYAYIDSLRLKAE